MEFERERFEDTFSGMPVVNIHNKKGESLNPSDNDLVCKILEKVPLRISGFTSFESEGLDIDVSTEGQRRIRHLYLYPNQPIHAQIEKIPRRTNVEVSASRIRVYTEYKKKKYNVFVNFNPAEKA